MKNGYNLEKQLVFECRAEQEHADNEVIENEKRIQILDIVVVIALFIVGCIAGKLVMTIVSDTWIAFDGPTIGVLAVGELIW